MIKNKILYNSKFINYILINISIKMNYDNNCIYTYNTWFIKIVLFIILLLIKIKIRKLKQISTFKYIKKKKIGIVGLRNHNNIGNIFVKFSMFKLLRDFGLDPIIIGITEKKQNIYFLKHNVKLKEINNSFFELKENDYDILMVNSDQTWNSPRKYLLDQGFLRFAQKWKIPKFVYGASLGHDYWKYSKSFDIKVKNLLKNFSGISVREKSAVNLVKKHLGIKPIFVLDPTLLIDKKNYLDLLKDFKYNFNLNYKYLCVYVLDQNLIIKKFIKECAQKLNYKTFIINRKNNYIENFIISLKLIAPQIVTY